MNSLLDILPPLPALFGQLIVGLINGSFYALLSLGLALIFGLLNVVNFAHGAQYMLGALTAWLLLKYLGISYWAALVIAPLVVGVIGFVIERLFLRHLYRLDHLYGMLMTFGITLIAEGVVRNIFGASGEGYALPQGLTGAWNFGFMLLPHYRGWVIAVSIVVCVLTWLAIEKTSIGSYVRAATENAPLTRAFGITRALNGQPVCEPAGPLTVHDVGLAPEAIEVTPRIGITHCADWPLRFVAKHLIPSNRYAQIHDFPRVRHPRNRRGGGGRSDPVRKRLAPCRGSRRAQ